MNPQSMRSIRISWTDLAFRAFLLPLRLMTRVCAAVCFGLLVAALLVETQLSLHQPHLDDDVSDIVAAPPQTGQTNQTSQTGQAQPQPQIQSLSLSLPHYQPGIRLPSSRQSFSIIANACNPNSNTSSNMMPDAALSRRTHRRTSSGESSSNTTLVHSQSHSHARDLFALELSRRITDCVHCCCACKTECVASLATDKIRRIGSARFRSEARERRWAEDRRWLDDAV
ncbi:hypothetical protein BC830DRAFT_1088604 [Chytriomyces sp. MP71]|nr:hypothetical protein BC830DRAFT_1088604 [Chytriomyces sp. MP71]